MKPEGWNSLEPGRQFVLARLSMGDEVFCDSVMPLTVRWVPDHPVVSNVSIGCEFDELPEDDRKVLQFFLARKLAPSRGSACGSSC